MIVTDLKVLQKLKKKDLIKLVIETEKSREELHTILTNEIGERYKKDGLIKELRQQIAELKNKKAPGTAET